MPRSIGPATTLETLRKEAKRWLKQLRAGDADARERFARAFGPAPATVTLRDVQHALAREYGHESWRALKSAVETPPFELPAPPRLATTETYERIANDWVVAYEARDEAALARLNAYYGRSFSFDDFVAQIWDRVYAYRQRSSKVPKNYLQPSEAQMIVAQDAGFGSWTKLMDAIATGAPPIPPFEVRPKENGISPRRQVSDKEWDAMIDFMKQRRLTTFVSGGVMTDAVLVRLAAVDHLTHLALGGSRQVTDAGLQHLARMSQLEALNLTGCNITDRGLEVLRHLPRLRWFELTWQRGVTDAGVANLRFCDRLERVDLMGSATGDGAIEALQGKFNLLFFKSGRLVTDAGLRFLQNFPMLKKWHGTTPIGPSGWSDDQEPGARLLIDGPFTNAGLESLAGLEGVAELDLFWNVTGITSDGFAHLVNLPNLAVLGADGKLSDNRSMQHMAALPRLRRLRAQEAVATDEGFEALSRSKTLQFLWGRRCEGLGSRGFTALSKMPALRGLGVSCKNVEDAALSTLPKFPALRELTPIDVRDDGFRHIGDCERLERLTCMYCRETTDAATEQIARLQIKYYYAGLTQITDRSLEILGTMPSLEQIDLYECNGVTNAGLVHLAKLPRLRQVSLDTLPGVTLEGTRVFPPRVSVHYST
jgi:hypothetical protein